MTKNVRNIFMSFFAISISFSVEHHFRCFAYIYWGICLIIIDSILGINPC